MKSRDTRRRKALRWSLYSVTAFVLATALASIWPKPYMYYKSPTNAAGVSTGISLVLLDGVLMSAQWKEEPAQPRTAPSTVSGFGSHGAIPPSWYMPPLFQRGYIKLPLAYPSALLLVASAVAFKLGRRSHPQGHCANCGYNLAGIESQLCPECGNREHT